MNKDRNTAFTPSRFALQTPKGDIMLERPLVMGILNINRDSFYAESRFSDLDLILAKVEEMLRDGAGIIDIGGMSSRPGAAISEPNEEVDKMAPVFEAIYKAFPDAHLSIDTVHSKVVEAIAPYVSLANDISAGKVDEELIKVVARLKLPYVLMHMKGIPETMQSQADYKDPVEEVYSFLEERIAFCQSVGIEQVIVDPGFGFGKTIEQNYTLLAGLRRFHDLGRPVLIGLSRKSMIWKKLNTDPSGALNGSTVLHTLSLMNAPHIIRAHDVLEAVQAIELYETFRKAQ